MSEVNKEWIQNVGAELEDSSVCPLYIDTRCPNNTIHCDECFKLFMNEHDAKVRAEAIDECIKVMKYSWYNGQQPLDVLVRRLEQLKEQNNE